MGNSQIHQYCLHYYVFTTTERHGWGADVCSHFSSIQISQSFLWAVFHVNLHISQQDASWWTLWPSSVTAPTLICAVTPCYAFFNEPKETKQNMKLERHSCVKLCTGDESVCNTAPSFRSNKMWSCSEWWPWYILFHMNTLTKDHIFHSASDSQLVSAFPFPLTQRGVYNFDSSMLPQRKCDAFV